jgi:nicotinamidase-related amidase
VRPTRNLQGEAKQRSRRSDCALLLIDFINDLEFEGGESLLPAAVAAARAAADLKRRARGAGIPVIYVNDNFSQWRSDFRQVVSHCRASRGSQLARLLNPAKDDYFVLKPRNSGFFQTPLQLLLKHLEVKKLVMTGLTADNCVLYTASDAYLLDFRLYVPADCVASMAPPHKEAALQHLARVHKATVCQSADLEFRRPANGSCTVVLRKGRAASGRGQYLQG